MKSINTLLLSLLLLSVVQSAQAGTKIYYVHNDHLATPKMMTDDQGTKVWEANHTPFGEATVDEDIDIDGELVTMNIRFPGQYYDQETGLHYNWNRYYDPAIGRYITSDPIGLDGGMNTYLYVSANPIVRFDALGLHGTHIYESVNTYWGAEVNAGLGGGLTVVTCQDECGQERSMVFAKVCVGVAFGATAGAGVVDGLDGEDCNPDTYDEWFFETGAAAGPVGISVDIGLPFGVVEAGPTVGLGAQIGSFCYYIYIGDR